MSQVVINFGTGGTSLNGQLGSTASPDSNDPKYLEWPGGNNGNYFYTSGTTNENVRAEDSVALSVTGDLDVRWYGEFDSWTTLNVMFVKRNSAAVQVSYAFYFDSSRRIVLLHSANGTAAVTAEASIRSTVGFAAPSVGNPIWLRATLDVDNGSSQHEVKYFTSDDGSTWTQLGTTRTIAGTTSIFDSTSRLNIHRNTDSGGTASYAGKLYRAQILNGIDGTLAFDADTSVITSGSAVSFVEKSANAATVSLNRITAGRKGVSVVSPVWLFGTDDFIEVADNSLIDFSNTQSFSLVAIYRQWANFGTNDTLIAKKANTTNTTQGYYLGSGASTAAQTQGQVGDGAAGATATETTSRTSGDVSVSTLVRNVAADTLTTFLNTTAGSAVTDATTVTSANTEAFRIGRLSGAGSDFSDMELVSVAVFRRALTATDIGRIVAYYQARLT